MKQPKHIEAIYPLSPMQQGMLFHTLYDPQSVMYFEQFCCRLRGDLDIQKFQAAWAHVTEYHPILRTAFVWQGKKQLQAVFKSVELPWLLLDWRDVPTEERLSRLLSWMDADRQQGFDLHRPPLMRFALLRVDENAYRFVWSHHHLLIDGWSLPIILREVLVTYEALRHDQAPALSPAQPYKAYITWLQQQDLAQAAAFWKETLGDFSTPTPLVSPTETFDHPTSPRYAEVDAELAPDVTARLQDLARRYQVTLSTLVQGAWALLLHHYCGADDVLFGTTVAGRPHEINGVEEMVGLFINTLPLRVPIEIEESLGTWLQTLQQRQTAMRAFEYSPLNKVQGWSGVAPEVPLFESLVVFESYPLEATLQDARSSLSIEDVIPKEHSNYPLTLIAHPGECLQCIFSYDEQRFDEITVARLARHFGNLLEGFLTHGNQPLLALSPLSEAERETMLQTWNATRTDYPRQQSIHALFEAQVARTPDAVAVTFEGERLTYRELDRRANQLAHHLRALDVGLETPVGLLTERSLEMVVGTLAILKAGGGYVPLNPDDPKARLRFLMNDTQMPVLLVQAALQDKVPVDDATRVVLDAEAGALAQMPETPPAVGVTPQHLAYIMYTSGSTGRPKGVPVTHQNVVRLVRNTNYATFSPDDVFLQFAPISFDAATLEIWGPLLNGGRLAVFPPELPGLDALGEFIQQEGVTTLWLTAGLFHQMVDNQLASLRGVRQLLAGGDVLSVPHVQKVLRQMQGDPERVLINGYGPTECTTFSCCYPMQRLDQVGRVVSIGRPIANAEAYILDRWMRPVPIGAPGELYIGGGGVARGYLRRPALTAERFVPHPFSDEPGARLYKTGDLARYLPDGRIEFLGRVDFQVKIRGFRVEPEEIAATLIQHRAVKEAVVVVHQDRREHKRLVAYLVPAMPVPPSLRELTRFLKRSLPDYMIPADFMVLDEMPLTPNGKIDRRALPSPERDLVDADYVAPRTPQEQTLAAIWSEVLGVDKVGARANFFALGGDSILSIQMVSRAAKEGLHFEVRQVFNHPVLADLAAVARTRAEAGEEPTEVSGTARLTPVQRWFFELPLPDPHHFNQAFLLDVRDTSLTPEMVEQAVNYLTNYHDTLRLRYRRTETGWEQSYAPAPITVPFRRVDLSALDDAAQQAALAEALAQAQAGLDIVEGPLTRCIWFGFGPAQPPRFFWVIHHLIVDGVSWRILLGDLEAACRQLQAGAEIDLQVKTTSYQSWAAQLHGSAEDALREADYWIATLQKATEALPVDHDAPPAENIEANAVMAEATLDEAQTQALLKEVPQAYNTEINDVLLAALGITLRRWTGRADALVELEGHGRVDRFEGVNLSRTVGWFTTMYPVRLEIPNPRDLGATLKSVKEQLRRVPQQGLGYGILRYLRDDAVAAQLATLPHPPVRFNYMGQYDQGVGEDALFVPLSDDTGPMVDPQAPRQHLIDIAGGIVRGKLWLGWAYCPAFHDAATVEALVADFEETLRRIIAHCCEQEEREFTPSDFPEARLDQASLDDLLSVIDQ